MFDHVMRDEMITFKKGTNERKTIRINPQMRSLKTCFCSPHAAGARDSEMFVNPDLTKVCVMVKCSPNMLYNNGIE